ncbi:MAG: LamG-like jellyroll fold domain-containing protein [Planctomycetota bacterium]
MLTQEQELLIVEAIELWQDGKLETEHHEAFLTLLKGSSEARKFYLEYLSLNADLHHSFDGVDGSELVADSSFATESLRQGTPSRSITSSALREVEPKASRRYHAALTLAAAVLAASVIGFVVRLGQLSDERGLAANELAGSESIKEETVRGVALLSSVVDVPSIRLDERTLSVASTGSLLPPGRLTFDSGAIQLEFLSGASVVIEGPADLDLNSMDLARLRTGKVRAQVPPAARGFRIELEELTVVDLGTEFAIDARGSDALVEVFDGLVELHEPGKKDTDTSVSATQLSAGQRVAIRGNSQGAPGASEVEFVDLESFADLRRERRQERLSSWLTARERWLSDERLLAYYSMNLSADRPRTLPAEAGSPSADLLEGWSLSEWNGAIVGASASPGRLLGESALEFRHPADRVRLRIGGRYGSLTLAAWVRIDSLDRAYNSLFLTDHYDDGEPHWQILANGRLYFSVMPQLGGKPRTGTGPSDFKARSPVFWNPSMSGRWMHLAVVFNADAQTITHYVDGKELSRHDIPEVHRVTTTSIGAATLGNWSVPTRPEDFFAIRNLNGVIDEFAIFASALSNTDIDQLYLDGKPD